jgi:hypothetical protein
MLKIVIGIFITLHGLVHLLYFGQSRRLFELQPGLDWPAGSWAFSKFISLEGVRWISGAACVLAAVGFVVGAAGLFSGQGWWRPVVIGSAVFSSVLYLTLWNGSFQKLDQQGGVGILINIAIVIAALTLLGPQSQQALFSTGSGG